MKFKKLAALALACTMAAGFGGCGTTDVGTIGGADGPTDVVVTNTGEDTSLEDVKANGKLIVGLDDTFVPMGFRDEAGNLVGFDIDLAKAVSEEMGIPFEFQAIDWDAKELELQNKKVDCLWNGLSITPEREEVMQFTDPYLDNRLVIMTKQGSDIKTKADLAGKNVGTQAGSSALDVVKADASYSTFQDTLTEYKDYDAAIMDLEIGRIEAVIVDEVLGNYKNNQKGNVFAFGTEDFGPDKYGVALRKEDTSLFEEFNKAFEAVIANGTASELSMKWFGKDIVLK